MSKFLTLYSWNTPNGNKPAILLEELKAAYGVNSIDYEVKPVNSGNNETKEEWYLKVVRLPLSRPSN
jgi:glutathione S-transferase